MMAAVRPPLLDRLIGLVSPRAALTRHFDRQRLQRAYEAASPRDLWRPRRAGASANADHQADAATLRTKARALVQNVPYMRAGLDALVSYTVGTGILPRSMSKSQGQRLNELFAQWMKVCDAGGLLDFHGLVAEAYRAMVQDGEVLVRLRTRRPEDGLPVPLQLQLLEIDWLDTTRTVAEGSANKVVNGIEYDILGKPAAYYLWDQHPGDTTMNRGLRTQSTRVPASSVIHLFKAERPGQGRGFTRFAAVMTRVRDLQLYEDAELARKNQEARLGVIYTGDASELENPAAGMAPNPSAAKQTGDLGELPSGAILGLPAGGNITVVEPKAAPGYVEYVKHQLHLIAAGIGVPYEMLTGDMREVNFSSARVRLLQFRQAVEQERWTTLAPMLLEPIWQAFVDAAYLAQRIRVAEDYAVDYSAPKWDYVNPEQDVQADLLEVSAGLSSLSEKLRQRGYKPQDVFDEMQRDFEDLKGRGLLDILMFLQKGATLDAAAAGEERAAAARARQATDVALERIAADVRAMMSRSPEVTVHNAPPAVTVHNEVPLPELRIDNHVPAAAVEVNVQPTPVTVEAPNVRIEPAQVTVEAPTVNVAPHVEVAAPVVHVTTPARKTEGTVERDGAGRIVRTTSVEIDIPPAVQPR